MLFLHLGLHKTGTTYFQHHVFPAWPNIHYLGRPFSGMWWKPIASSDLDKYLISVESLLCRLRGDLVFNPNVDWGETSLNRIERLHELFPNAHVIVAFRDTADWAYSLYGSYLRQGGTKTRKEFVGDGAESVMKTHELLNHRRLTAFTEAWGERFYPLLYSDLRSRHDFFIRQLATIMKTPVPTADLSRPSHRNSSYTLNMEKAFRALNRFDSGANVSEVEGRFNYTKAEKNRLVRFLGLDRERLAARLARFFNVTESERHEIDDWRSWLRDVYSEDWATTESKIHELQVARGIHSIDASESEGKAQ